MYSNKDNYDRGVNTFSPEGRIFQIEYAIESIKLGSTSIGIQTAQGVVIGAEKRVVSKLMEPTSVTKISEIDTHIGCVASGLIADAKILVEHARVETQNHRFTYNEPMKVETCTLSTCDLSLRFGESSGKKKLMSRPFGVSLLIAGVDEEGPQLWHTDPSGTYTKYEAKAIGAGAEAAQATLSEQYHKSMTREEAEVLVVAILKQVMEEQLSKNNIELAVVHTDTRRLDVYGPDQLQSIIERAK